MTTNSYPELREMILDIIAPRLERAGMNRATFDDDTNLLSTAILDSFDYLDMVLALEEKSGASIDFAELEDEPIDTVRGLLDGIIKQNAPK